MSLDGFPSERGHGRASSLSLVTESSIEIVGKLDRGSLHVCQHTRSRATGGCSASRRGSGQELAECVRSPIPARGQRHRESAIRSALDRWRCQVYPDTRVRVSLTTVADRRRHVSQTATSEALCCSFCTKSQFDVLKLIAGPGVLICNECVDLCNQIITDEMQRQDDSARSGAVPATDVPPALKAWDGLSDDELLDEMVRAHGAHQNVDRAVKRHVAALRDRGVSWARIGEALGMARQSAWERFSGEE